jgi:hypothetical protein
MLKILAKSEQLLPLGVTGLNEDTLKKRTRRWKGEERDEDAEKDQERKGARLPYQSSKSINSPIILYIYKFSLWVTRQSSW